ncbi:hypothetical protein RB195_007175 [Necator americanus]|uniref:Uncharacterized protein n=1 Tax=Necator americanus TaxID=51031 RepID=A0ABR1BYV3_NECAM
MPVDIKSSKKPSTTSSAKGTHGSQKSSSKAKDLHYKFDVKKGEVLAIPTLAIPYYPKYDNATDSSSEYSEPPEEVSEFPGSNFQYKAERTRKSLLASGYDIDGRMLCEDVLFSEPDQAAAFTPMVMCEKPVEIECICLWDFFGGDTCLDVNCWAGTELNVIAEEYQVRSLSANAYLRPPLRWSLVRNVGDHSRSTFGLIPSCWLVSKKFLEENHALFSPPLWYLGICDVDVAYRHLMRDRSAQRPGVFVIFSPVCMNPDPTEYRPFLLMFLCEKDPSYKKIGERVVDRERRGRWFDYS